VDGAPRAGTVLTLSHWPGTPTPPELWADLSAEIALRALARPDLLPEGVDVASVDHYDADGAISLALLCVDGLAEAHGDLLVEAARAGDFAVVTSRSAALVAFALGAILEIDCRAAESSAGDDGPPGFLSRSGQAASRALEILPELAEDPSRHETLWRAEADAFDASVAALAEGWATIEIRPAHDLAVVRVDTTHPHAPAAAWGGAPLHRAAVHSFTDQLRVATVAGERFELRYRYESWVRLVSRRPRGRVDLTAAARELDRAEPGTAHWEFDGAGAVTGALHLAADEGSSLSAEHFLEVACRHLDILDTGEPAWDPYSVPARA
jgi:hypothetical protein